jgi:hypothetical protein
MQIIRTKISTTVKNSNFKQLQILMPSTFYIMYTTCNLGTYFGGGGRYDVPSELHIALCLQFTVAI